MLGQFNDAVVDLKKAYSLDPTNASISANLSAAYQQSIAT
ncbi:MAG: tetratricopeptide repeat protein [Planctomycetes bacterium]|nr:tetratricopeptide repeat protein [Planctomycetota bacterium]